MQRPSPEQYNPPLTWQAQLWRMTAAVAFSGVLWSLSAPAQWEQARWLFWLDLSFGLVALGLTFFRRRWPFAVAAVTSILGSVSVTANGPGTLATVSLATRRVIWQLAVILLLSRSRRLHAPDPARHASGPVWIDYILGLLSAIAMIVGGMYIGSRRELMWTLRDRAERAEAEQALRVEQGQLNERARIAREMHDVLGHRISLIAMHAGALAYRTDLTAAETHQTAELIQATSHEALTDLRQVLGVLRDDETGALRERPQPTFGDLTALVLEAEGAGMRIQYDDRVVGSAQMPDQVGRTAYRIVQEGLTNVRKHAPGVTVVVQLSGSPTEGVSIRIRNPARTPRSRRRAHTRRRAGTGRPGRARQARGGSSPRSASTGRSSSPGGCRGRRERRDPGAGRRRRRAGQVGPADDPRRRARHRGGRRGGRRPGRVSTPPGEHRPDVVLMDIRMPRMDGLEATEVIGSWPDPPKVIVLTTFDADDYVARALGAGASGFLLKDTAPAAIVDAIRRVADGDPMLSPSVTTTLIEQLTAGRRPTGRGSPRPGCHG